MIELLDGVGYLAMLSSGARRLDANRKIINDLNVFPIPDGDTGDNMFMTISAGCRKASEEKSQNLSIASKQASSGMLFGARGNSGVILSRIFAGMSKGLEGLEQADVKAFVNALTSAVSEAYASVSNPVEGTILTVLKDSVSYCSENHFSSYEELFSAITKEMDASLQRTPELLPVLKEAGVVDSGGAGLLVIFEGMADALKNGLSLSSEDGIISAEDNSGKVQKVNLDDFGPDSVLEFGYCTEFLLRLQRAKVGDIAAFDESQIRDYLTANGDSVVCFKDDSIVKVHVHTKTPGDILSHCQKWGEYLTVKVENMSLQHEATTIQDNFSNDKPAQTESFAKLKKKYAVVTVVSGDGLEQIFREAGADYVIKGGQTMNPSANDFIQAFDEVNAETIFVFPNNSNIVMTAQQAAGIYTSSKVVVLPCKTIGGGYVAIASLDTSINDVDAITTSICETLDQVVSGSVSVAIRDAEQNGLSIKQGEYIGFERSRILVTGKSRNDAAVNLADKLDISDHEVALFFKGSDTPQEEADALVSDLQAKFPRTEIIMNNGGQPVFDYILILC